MLDQAPAPLAGARRHDLPRSAGGRAPVMPAEPGLAGLTAAIDRHLGAGRRLRQPLSLLAVGIRSSRHLDGRPAPELLHHLALEAGQRLRARVRGTDTVLWSGPLEFVAVLNDCRHDSARVVQQRLLAGLGEIYRLGADRVTAAIGIGCACHPAAGETGAQLLAAAQQARGPLDLD